MGRGVEISPRTRMYKNYRLLFIDVGRYKGAVEQEKKANAQFAKLKVVDTSFTVINSLVKILTITVSNIYETSHFVI